MAPTVQMYIDKFDKVVTIDEDHPLAVAQREKDAKAAAVKATTPRRAPRSDSGSGSRKEPEPDPGSTKEPEKGPEKEPEQGQSVE